ncbi:MAG: HAMP domain-containing sensor histidine kinase [Geothrix sp.]|nr:HAMP domain-containing sensor histidine kinase [Geothrix sp.]
MNYQAIFESISSFDFILLPDGIVKKTQSPLFPISDDFFSLRQISFYKTAQDGWITCPRGAECLIWNSPWGTKLAFPGLFKNKIGKKFFESILKSNINAINIITNESNEANTRARQHLHEIRGLNSVIYHAAYALAQNQDFSYRDRNEKVGNILHGSELSKLRLDLADFTYKNTPLPTKKPYIPYQAFESVYRIMQSFSYKDKNVRLNWRAGNSNTTQIMAINGFKLIPFLLLDNAIKYSPEGASVEIFVQESSKNITCGAKSLGPLIEDDEKTKIFELGYRGTHAQKSGQGGSGIGLYYLKQLVELHDGLIEFEQATSKTPAGTLNSHHPTTFRVTLPIPTQFQRA